MFFNIPDNLLYLFILKAFSLFCLLTAFFILFKTVILNKLEQFSKKTKNKIDDIIIEIIQEIKWFFYITLAFYISIQLLEPVGFIKSFINTLFLIVLTYQIIKSAQVIVNHTTETIIRIHKQKHPDEDTSVIVLLSKIVRFSLWFLGILLILSNLGYNITTLITGLGIGGIAVALAIQNILTDIFSSFSIYLDKPFQVGDFIAINNEFGTVKHIGIKTTRLETKQGEELIIPNKILINTKIQNFKRMDHRRVIFQIFVDFEKTSITKIKKIPKIISKIIIDNKNTELERVHLKKIQGQRLIFEISYILPTKDINLYRDTHQEINLKIAEEFKRNKIAFHDDIDIIKN